MRLIVECDGDGCVFVYRESERHYKLTSEIRSEQGLILRSLESLDENCTLSRGEYVEVRIQK